MGSKQQKPQGPAAVIRKALGLELGLRSSKVSVRTSSGSGVRVEIKDPGVHFPSVEKIAKRSEKIDRDGFGEILQGGNTFVFVSWSKEARQIRGSKYVEGVLAAMAELEGLESESALIPIAGAPETLIGWSGPAGCGFRLWHDGTARMHVNTAECAAAMVADYQTEMRDVLEVDEDPSLYTVTRLYADSRGRRVVKKGLSLEEAKEHCRNPETSSATAKSSVEPGEWFDGYDVEK